MTEASRVVLMARGVLSALVYVGLWFRVLGGRREGTYTVSPLFIVCISCVWLGLVRH